VLFGRGTSGDAAGHLDGPYALLTTPRAQDAIPALRDGAREVHHVAPGLVDELSAQLLGQVADVPILVAVGGGRVVDTAKAIAAGRGGTPRVAAVPTTLSAAEMTHVHRLPKGSPRATTSVRPWLVVNDPALSASQPERELAASAANALAHAVEGPVTTRSSPVPALAGGEAVRLIAAAYGGDEVDRDTLALAALLSGYAIDSAGYGLHHVLSQTLVRVGGAAHGDANAAMLPHTTAALRDRFGDAVPAGAEELAAALAARAGATRVRDIGVEEDALAACASTAASRDELALTPPVADEAELLALYRAAW
jgi:alcohol dehydrogenase class IV